MSLDKLEEMLKIGDKQERRKVMTDYAISLKANVLKVKQEDGEIDENELTVLIYDALREQKRKKHQLLGILFGALVMLILFGALMFVFGNFIAPSMEEAVFIKEEPVE